MFRNETPLETGIIIITKFVYLQIASNANLMTDMTGSNDSLKFEMKYNFMRLELSEFYLVPKYHFLALKTKILRY